MYFLISVPVALGEAIGFFFGAWAATILCKRVVQMTLASVTIAKKEQRKSLKILDKALYGTYTICVVITICILGAKFTNDNFHKVSSYHTSNVIILGLAFYSNCFCFLPSDFIRAFSATLAVLFVTFPPV